MRHASGGPLVRVCARRARSRAAACIAHATERISAAHLDSARARTGAAAAEPCGGGGAGAARTRATGAPGCRAGGRRGGAQRRQPRPRVLRGQPAAAEVRAGADAGGGLGRGRPPGARPAWSPVGSGSEQAQRSGLAPGARAPPDVPQDAGADTAVGSCGRRAASRAVTAAPAPRGGDLAPLTAVQHPGLGRRRAPLSRGADRARAGRRSARCSATSSGAC